MATPYDITGNAQQGSLWDIDYVHPPKATPPPGKYPIPVGRKYYGEFAGYTYNPWEDTYYRDPKAHTKYKQSTGIEKKPQSMWQQLTSSPSLWALAAKEGLSALPKLMDDPNQPATPGGGLMALYNSIFDPVATADVVSGPGVDPTANYGDMYEPVIEAPPVDAISSGTDVASYDPGVVDTGAAAADVPTDAAPDIWDTIAGWFGF